MLIYHYHPDTGVFLGVSQADESPLEPGVFLVPADATEKPVPAFQASEYARFDGERWTVEPIPTPPAEPEPPTEPAVPDIVTMRQARRALLAAGLLSQVDAVLAAIPDDLERQAAVIDWEYATTVERSSSLVQSLSVALGLDEAALDSLFLAAASTPN